MKLTIVPVDGTVLIDGVGYTNLDLSRAEVPQEVHALQWYANAGTIENKDLTSVPIAELPKWALACVDLWQEMHDEATAPPPDPTPEQQLEQAQRSRQEAYTAEADPLFFKWQAGEGTEAEWLAKREEIRSRFPYPEIA